MSRDIIQISHTVPAYETGPDDRMHYHWLMCHLQEAATAHADREGFGGERLHQLGCFWVLTSMRIELDKMPERQKEFSLTTWSRGAKRLRAFRDFSGCDELGNEILRASSEWMVLDCKTRKPITIDDRINLLAKDKSVFPDTVKRLRPGKPLKTLDSIIVKYSSLDASGHVNNTEYLRWAIDALRNQGLKHNKVHTIRMAFLSEVFEGDCIELISCSNDDPGFELLGYNKSKNKPSFALKLQ